MKYYDFFKFLKKWRKAKRYPTSHAWPNKINLDKNAWEGIQKLYNHTKMDGHEYETSFFFVEGKTYLSTPLRGSRENVKVNHSLQIKYDVDQRRRLYYRNILLDGKIVEKKAIKPEKMPEETDTGFLFNVHTHPEHINKNNEITYSFFSTTDIRSLINSQAMITGLITDAFYLACKTDNIISKIGEVGEEMLYEISQKAFNGDQYLNDIINEKMKNWGLVFYRGDFKKSLIRIN